MELQTREIRGNYELPNISILGRCEQGILVIEFDKQNIRDSRWVLYSLVLDLLVRHCHHLEAELILGDLYRHEQDVGEVVLGFQEDSLTLSGLLVDDGHLLKVDDRQIILGGCYVQHGLVVNDS